MPPKKDDSKVNPADTVVGFEPRETKLLAAGFLSSIGPDKYDYDVMATLTGNTAGSLKKMFPPVKRKAMEAYPSFATFLGTTAPTDGTNGEEKAAPKAAARKRKATSEPDEAATKDLQSEGEKSNDKADGKKKAKGRPRGKKTKTEKDDNRKETAAEEAVEGDEYGDEV